MGVGPTNSGFADRRVKPLRQGARNLNGGGRRIRTDSLLSAKQMLFRWSYTPTELTPLTLTVFSADSVGFEPTSALTVTSFQD